MADWLPILVAAYLIGSVPTALIVSRLLGRGDIRQLGDGNMGARNVARSIGWAPGAAVGLVDFGKGAIGVWLATQAGLSDPLRLAAGLAAVAGHDFPLWAGFQGGQGMATSLGVLSLLLPAATLVGLVLFALAYLLTRVFDLSAAIGLGSIIGVAWWRGEPPLWVAYGALLFVSIGVKKVLDHPRRQALREQVQQERA